MSRYSAAARAAAFFALAASWAAAAVGCDSLRSSAMPEAPLWLHHPGGALSVVLRRPVTSEARQVGELYERGRPEIDAAHRRVFVGSSDRGLYAIRAEDGSTIWRFETLGAVQCEPLYDATEDVVYFGSNDGALYKARASDGRRLWRFATNAEVARRPVLRDGVLYVTNANDTLLALDAATGRMKWHQHRTPAFGMEVAGYAGPALGNDKVYAAFSDGVVLAYSMKDGSEQWPAVDLAAEAEQTSGDLPRYLDVDTTPILDRIDSGEVVFVASYIGGVHALDADNGTRAWVNDKAVGVTELALWRQPAHKSRDGGGTMTPERRVLVAASGLSGLWGIDPNDGRTLWRRKLPEGGISAPVPAVGAILVTTTRYGIFLFSPLDGSLIDGIDTGGGYAMTPAVQGTRGYVMSNAGLLVELHIEPPPSVPHKPL
jgi:outer membrane protein assembly factor BamB